MSSLTSPLLSASELRPACGNLPALELQTPGGSSAQIYAYGAHVASWKVAGKGEQFFVSQQAEFSAGKAIRGGVPVIFPQFGAFGPGAKHGFARNCLWQWLPTLSNNQTAVFELTSNTQTLSIWPFAFRAHVTVILGEDDLRITLNVINTDTQSFEFTSALHSYFAVTELDQTSIIGLADKDYWDNGTAFSERGLQQADSLQVRDALDRVYFKTPGPLELQQPHQRLHIDSEGFVDTVIWNPGKTGAAALHDFADDEYRNMLCIESAIVENSIVLAPQQQWSGTQLLRVD